MRADTIGDVTPSADLIDALRQAGRIAVLTGAGVSAESGVPTFRDALTGLWSDFKPEDLATPAAFRRNPKLVWDWYASRRRTAQAVQPNPGHHALAELERRVSGFTLITQNVDGLHHRAGSRNVIELHGNITRVKCFSEGTPVADWNEEEAPPRCQACGDYLRPDVVWFTEALPDGAFESAEREARTCDIFLSIGTSSVVYPAALLPEMALRARAVVVEINPDETPLTRSATFSLRGTSAMVLPALLRSCGWADRS
jgi:NAD-dependent deacetylase